jgi:hypothetical protein
MASPAVRYAEAGGSLCAAAGYVAGLPAQARRTASTHAHVPSRMVAVGHGSSRCGVCGRAGHRLVERAAFGLRGGSAREAVRYAERCLERTTGRDEGARKSRGFSPSRARARDGLACRKVGGQDAGDTDETPSSFASAKRRATAGTGRSGSFVACTSAGCQPGVCRGTQRAGRAGCKGGFADHVR